MSKRLALAVLGVCAAGVLTIAGAGCGEPAVKKPQEEINFEAMPPATRLLTIEVLGPNTEGAVAALGGLLNDKSFIVRAEAAQTLGTWAAVGDAYLILPALVHKDPLVRGMAQVSYIESNAYALAPLVTEGNIIEVPPPLLKALADLGDPYGQVDVNKTILRLQEVLRSQLDGPPETAVLAADLLARTGDAGARRTVIRLIESAEGPIVPKAVAACVRNDMGLGPTLLPLAFDGDVPTRRAVMAALVAHPDAHLKALPLRGLRDGDVAVRHNAIRALGNLGAAAPLDALTARLLESGGEKTDILRALGVIGKPAANTLRGYLQRRGTPDELQVNALLALAPNANRDDVTWISQRLRSPNRHVRAAAATALGKIGHPSAQAVLAAAAKDNEPLVRATVAKALGQIGTVYGAKQLLTMLEDPSPLVSSMAAWGLGAATYPEAVPALKKVAKARVSSEATASRLGEMYGWPELSALEALGHIGTPEALVFLSEALGSKSWLTRATAAQALGTAGNPSPEIIQALEKRLDDPVNLVRAQALVSLRTLGKTFVPGEFQRH